MDNLQIRILALLAIKSPQHGYGLRQQLVRSGLNLTVSRVYRALTSMTKKGLAVPIDMGSVGGKPVRRGMEITPEGARQLIQALDQLEREANALLELTNAARTVLQSPDRSFAASRSFDLNVSASSPTTERKTRHASHKAASGTSIVRNNTQWTSKKPLQLPTLPRRRASRKTSYERVN